jgi:putative heme transporter
MSEGGGGAVTTTGTPAQAPKKRIGVKQIVAFVFGIVIVIAIFVYAIPKFADYGDVWNAMKTLTPIESLSLLAATLFNLFTYWLANQAALPGLRLSQSVVVTQTGTSVANTLPAGGAIAIGVTYAILESWGFTAGEATLFVGVTGIWNIFTKLALPVLALALLVLTGNTYPALVGAAAVGIAVLAGAVILLALVFKSKAMARRVGEFLGRVVSAVLKPFRKAPIMDMGDRAVKFRKETIVLVERRWLRLTWTTVLSQIALFFVLLLSLRHMGVSEQDVATVEVFAVYAFSRLLSSVPITPGGVGVIDLGYIAGLSAFKEGEHAAIVAGVLIFRVLTYGIQIPIGAFTYFVWRRKHGWMRDTPPPGSIAGELEARAAESAAA